MIYRQMYLTRQCMRSISGERNSRCNGRDEITLTGGKRPFADAVRAGVGAIMCSYNKINGTNSCENGWTSNYLLKNELNFQGFGIFPPSNPRTGTNSYQLCPTGAPNKRPSVPLLQVLI